MYRVFARRWWKHNPAWPDGREPDATGRKRTIARNVKTIEEARRIAQDWNATHKPGPLSIKAEFEEQ